MLYSLSVWQVVGMYVGLVAAAAAPCGGTGREGVRGGGRGRGSSTSARASASSARAAAVQKTPNPNFGSHGRLARFLPLVGRGRSDSAICNRHACAYLLDHGAGGLGHTACTI